MSRQPFTALLSVLIFGHRLFSGGGLGLPVVPGATLPWVTDLSVRRRLGRWGSVPRTHCKCCTVMSCSARRLRQD